MEAVINAQDNSQCKAFPVFRKKGQRAVDVVEVRVLISPIQEGGLQRNSVFKSLGNVILYVPVTGPIRHAQSCADVLSAATQLVKGQNLVTKKPGSKAFEA